MIHIEKIVGSLGNECLKIDEKYIINISDDVRFEEVIASECENMPKYVLAIRDIVAFVKSNATEMILMTDEGCTYKKSEVVDISDLKEKELDEIISLYEDLSKIDNVANLVSGWLKELKVYRKRLGDRYEKNYTRE